MIDLLTRPRTPAGRAARMLRVYRHGSSPTDARRLLWDSYVVAYGDPTEPRPDWYHKGTALAEMMSGRRMRRIPRELRRIYAPYP